MCGQKSGLLKRPFTGLAAAGPWGYSNAKWHPDQRHWCTAGNCRWVDQPGTAESFAALSFRRVLTTRYTPDRCHFSGKNHWYINHQIGGHPIFIQPFFPGNTMVKYPKRVNPWMSSLLSHTHMIGYANHPCVWVHKAAWTVLARTGSWRRHIGKDTAGDHHRWALEWDLQKLWLNMKH